MPVFPSVNILDRPTSSTKARRPRTVRGVGVVAAALLAVALTAVPANAETPPTPYFQFYGGGTTVYPYPDGYLDTIDGQLLGDPPTPDPSDSDWMYYERLEIADSTGAVVYSDQTTNKFTAVDLSWGGTDNAGVVLPQGSYTLRGYLVDDAGAMSAPAVEQLTVVRQRVEGFELHTTARPARALSSSWVGACSRLERIRDAAWPRALRLSSDVDCSRTLRASTVRTTYGTQPPEMLSHGAIEVTVTGGADVRRARSVASGRARLADGSWTSAATLQPFVGDHTVVTLPGTDVVASPQRLSWRVTTTGRARYEVLALKVSMSYTALVPDGL